MSSLKIGQAFRSAVETAAADSALDLNKVRLVVGVSGGPDSLALLHLMSQTLRPDQIIVAHLDHGLRPSSADEAEFVARAAADWGLQFAGSRVDVAARSESQNQSIEEAGRDARYAFFAAVADEAGAQVIATGHNAGDQTETVLMHFLRGSGLAGLQGMKIAGPVPGHEELWLWRPLLEIGRDAIEQYCHDNQLAPLLDESNTDTNFLRNKLRHELLPLLREYSPNIDQRLRNLAAITAADLALLDELTALAWQETVVDVGSGWLELSLPRWRDQPLGLRRALLRRAVENCSPQVGDIGFATIEAARELAEMAVTGSQATLPGNTVLSVSYETLDFAAPTANRSTEGPQLETIDPLYLSVPGHVELGNGYDLFATEVDNIELDTIHNNSDPWLAYVDPNSFRQLTVRPRQVGERYQPLGLLGHYAKLSDLMIDQKIAGPLRKRWPIVTGGDFVVWIPGLGIDERARVRPDSERVILLRCERP